MKSKAHWIGLAVTLVAVAALRIHLLDVPFERDEGEYAYGASLLLDGVPPFSGMYTMKLPGTQVMYALSMLLFGRTIGGVHLGLLLVNLATILLVYLLGRRLLRPPGALGAAVVFAGLSISPAFFGFLAHATHYVILFAVAGLLVLQGALGSRRKRALFAAGALLGLAVLMKQAGLVFPLFGVAWWCSIRLRVPHRAATLREGASLCAGIAAPYLLMVGWIAAAGTLDAYWFWTVSYAREYATEFPLRRGLLALAGVSYSIAKATWPLLAVCAAGITLALWRRRDRSAFLLVALLVFSFAGVSIGFYFRRHYFILALPALSLLAGFALQEISARKGALLAGAVAAIACLVSLAARAQILFLWPPEVVSQALYGFNPFPEAVQIGKWVHDHTRPGESVAVLGSEPEILFYSGRRSATGHIYMYWLMEEQPYAARMQQQVISEIQTARPAYVVWVLAPGSWMRQPESLPLIFDWSTVYLQGNYRVVGRVDRGEDGVSRYSWETPEAGLPFTDDTLALVLQRNDLLLTRASRP